MTRQERIDKYVNLAKAEIREYAKKYPRFFHASSFAELHDYCDANMIGGTEELAEELCAELRDEEAGYNAAVDITNAGGDIIDAWIKNGGHRVIEKRN